MPRKKKEAPTRKNKQYEVKVEVGKKIDGTTIRKSFYSPISKADAQKKADEYILEREIANRTGQGFINKDITFAEWAMEWLEVYKKPDVDERTYVDTYLNAVKNHLIPFFKTACLQNIKPVDVKAFYASKSHLSASMLSKMRLCLHGIFETAIDNNLCYKDPSHNIKYTSKAKKQNKKVYTDAQILAVKSLAYHTMPEIVILLETGLRRGELLGLQRQDIDFTARTLSVNRSIADKKGGGITVNPPKWDSYRKNPLSQPAFTILSQLVPNKEGYIFTNKFGNPQSPSTWAKKLDRFMATLPNSIPRLTAHELRHTYGTYLRRQGVDIYTIQKIMGHKDISMTTEIYVHNEIDTLKQNLEVIEGGTHLKKHLS